MLDMFRVPMAGLVSLILMFPCAPARAQVANTTAETAVEDSSATLRTRAMLALRQGDTETAIKMADGLVGQHADEPGSVLLAADVYLRCGKVEAAVNWFDRYLKTSPAALPDLWQRGIALYFAGDYKRGAAQFEEHRKVNPHDVENAAWHFLCVAKSESLETAQRLVLPAPNDPRVPMEEVLAMLSSGNTDAVKKRMDATAAGSIAREQAEFYGNFYLGLHADARGDSTAALRLLKLSAAEAPHHYMGDIARVYVQFLEHQAAGDTTADPAK